MYLGKLFLGMRTIINRIFKENSLTVTSGLFSRLKAKLVTCLHLTTEFHRSYVLIVDRFRCGGCNATYYGEDKRHFKVKMCEHLGISVLTGKRVKGNDESAITKHLSCCNRSPDFEDFISLTTNNDFKFTSLGSL